MEHHGTQPSLEFYLRTSFFALALYTVFLWRNIMARSHL